MKKKDLCFLDIVRKTISMRQLILVEKINVLIPVLLPNFCFDPCDILLPKFNL